ncbi:hypothetical protein JZ751_013221 [Albula glossodonta]|uniref:Granulins domain-containing protein n=1 Tax=Albula glossodonta TaxID=121402 RepID=A0A8T2NX15_9TELE|nr:hypothetical protein JZ751_013221 [Albula glossodonta]
MWKSGLLSLALFALAGAITCPDGSTCDDDSTCCQMLSGKYGCCPEPRAVCCEDHEHCCPEGTTCDLAHSKCTNATHRVPIVKKVPAKPPAFPRSFPMVHASSGSEEDDTICPDHSHCPSEYSCQKSHSSYKCCPLAQAVSCSDGKHCCPDGHECSEDGHSCVKKKAEPLGAVVCPDGVSECPGGTTCCQLLDGSWGCCPMPKAVCCEDRAHCCPEGSYCDITHSKCRSETHGDTPMWEKFPARRRESWENQIATNIPCNDSVACPDGSTCCKKKDGDWTCCPLPEAVCCDDDIHCCPKDTTCDVSAGMCNGGKGTLPWLEKMPALRRQSNKAGNVTCDSTHACPDGTTCCQKETGDWACCPLPEAVCCDDHIHCCPKDTTCDVAAGMCNGGKGTLPWLEKMPALRRQHNKVGNVTCDSTHACPDGTTCCQKETGDWACCPLPEDTTCDVAAGMCNGGKGTLPWLEKMPALRRQSNKAGNVTCDSTHACPDGTTCCQKETGDWACCPLPEAVCCDDHIHCCPKDTTCDVAAGMCNGGKGTLPWLEKMPALRRQSNKAGNVTCDSTHACPDGTTCCQKETGDWACCPLPEDTTCDVAAGMCNGGKGTLPWLEKMPALRRQSNKAGNVTCDSTHACPDGTTCCQKETGDWACCPLPEDTTCDVAAGMCNGGKGTLPWLEKMPALRRQSNKAGNVTCDSTHACPDGTTCCQKETGDWACCPLPEAVCCDDHIHCCPKDTTCDVAAGMCNGGKGTLPWLEKMPALRRQHNKVGNVTCDSTHACPDGTTCCQKETGDWACCPLPEDTTCDVAAGMCNGGKGTLPWLEKMPALRRQSNKAGNVTCDSTHACPDGTTCCQKETGDWACCPLPEDTTCDVAAGMCNGGKGTLPWLEKMPALRRQSNKAGNVTCDSTHACPDGTTCCQKETGDWACCPLPEDTTCDVAAGMCNGGKGTLPWLEKMPALRRQSNKAGNVTCDSTHACPDGTTCCQKETGDWACCPLPEDTTCDVAAGMCNGGKGTLPWLEKMPALRRQSNKAGNVTCDSTHACPDGTTCCQKETGDWACCPLPEAVCCDDHIHCCPKDTTCDVAAGMCNGGKGTLPWLEKMPALRRQHNKAGNVTCDSTHACPDGTTCCQKETGDWACCPLPEAVCCDDHIHCCPKDTTCDVAAGMCNGGKGTLPWLEKMPALRRQSHKAGNVTCDSTHACPDGTTCCQKETGDWACCPLPEDTTCDVAAGMCNGGKGTLPWLEKMPALRRQSNKAGNVTCDSTHACPDGTTCCQKETGDWACCPLPEAVCCDDHIHCCPKDTTCDVAAGMCNGGKGTLPWLEKMPALRRQSNKAGNVTCDSTHACPDGTTCCQKETGDWACCPLPEAVCCDDHIHCCPKDTTCDVAAGMCNGGKGTLPWLEKMPALRRQHNKAGNVTCDSTHACPDGTTCCQKETGDWACCPLPEVKTELDINVVSFTRNPLSGMCNGGKGTLPWLEKMPALRRQSNKAGNVTCDSTHACPDGTTCCQKETGDWACCPLPEAVCCDDHIHCCPKDTTCDVAAGMCNGASGSLPWLEKVPVVSKVSARPDVRAAQLDKVQCNPQTSCPKDTTCCFMSRTNKWGCCPLPKAVCCVDGEHCCPSGYKCDGARNTCYKGRIAIPWYTKIEALTGPASPKDVPCDPKSSCATGSTCCPLPMGQWGCCPMEKAVCCSDMKHCCPAGYSCDPKTGSCSRSGALRWDGWGSLYRKRRPSLRL